MTRVQVGGPRKSETRCKAGCWYHPQSNAINLQRMVRADLVIKGRFPESLLWENLAPLPVPGQCFPSHLGAPDRSAQSALVLPHWLPCCFLIVPCPIPPEGLGRNYSLCWCALLPDTCSIIYQISQPHSHLLVLIDIDIFLSKTTTGIYIYQDSHGQPKIDSYQAKIPHFLKYRFFWS